MSIRAVSWALEQQINDPIAKLVLIGIADRYNDDRGYAWPSVAWLATAASCSRRTVQRKVGWLEEEGYLTRQISDLGTETNHYGLSLEGGRHTDTGVTALSPGGRHSSVTRTIDNNKNNNKGKQLLCDWSPDDDDRKYAADLGLDADDILTTIRLWDEQNGNKASYASVKAFWQGWCRREAKRSPRGLKRQQTAFGNKGTGDWLPGSKMMLSPAEWAGLSEAMQKYYVNHRPDLIAELRRQGVAV